MHILNNKQKIILISGYSMNIKWDANEQIERIAGFLFYWVSHTHFYMSPTSYVYLSGKKPTEKAGNGLIISSCSSFSYKMKNVIKWT